MVALFLLSQVFLIVSHGPLVRTLAAVILKSNLDNIKNGTTKLLEECEELISSETVAFLPPTESLEKSLENLNEPHNCSKLEDVVEENKDEEEEKEKEEKNVKDEEVGNKESLKNENEKWYSAESEPTEEVSVSSKTESSPTKSELNKVDITSETIEDIKHLSVTDEEKEQRLALESPLTFESTDGEQESLSNIPFLETILNSLYCTENDYAALFALCLLYALANNPVILFITKLYFKVFLFLIHNFNNYEIAPMFI